MELKDIWEALISASKLNKEEYDKTKRELIMCRKEANELSKRIKSYKLEIWYKNSHISLLMQSTWNKICQFCWWSWWYEEHWQCEDCWWKWWINIKKSEEIEENNKKIGHDNKEDFPF